MIRLSDLALMFQGDLRANGEVRLFKLGAEAGECCLLLTEDYRSHVSIHAAQLGISMQLMGKNVTCVVNMALDLLDFFSRKHKDIFTFYSRPVLAFRYCRCLHLCVCVRVCVYVCVRVSALSLSMP